MNWTLKHIEQLKAKGKIRNYSLTKPSQTKQLIGGRKVAKHFKKRSKEKDFIAWNLLIWCQERHLQMEEEYKFHPDRKWRFDWCIPALNIAIEYNGIMSKKSRHTTVTGYTGDMNKLNAAQTAGWKVLQFTPLNYKELISIIHDSTIK